MFSGIVEGLGRVSGNDIAAGGRLRIEAPGLPAKVGDSVAVNGCCLTVAGLTEDGFIHDVMPETARRTNLQRLAVGDGVNVEGSLALGERVGGHLVTGHIDAVGEVRSIAEDGNALRATIQAPPVIVDTLVPQGCVAVDGISLTVVDVLPDGFTVSLIPHTLAVTTAGRWQSGSRVNLEADITAKYVARAVSLHLDARAAATLEHRSP